MNLFHKKIASSLRAKLMFFIEAFVIVLVITIGIITTVREKDTLVNELHKRGFALASDLARFVARPLINQDLAGLRRFVIYSMEQDYVEHIVVLDKHNDVVMHSDLTKVGKPYEFLTEGENIYPETRNGKIEHSPDQNPQQCDIFVPIKISDVKLGTIILGYSHRAVAEEIAEAQNQIVLFVIAAIIIGAIFSYILATLISAPIKKITKATEKLANGNLDVLLNIKRNDEIGILASSFNKMARDLQQHQRLLESQLQQAQKMEAIGTLAGGIAHDFNNILQGIIGYIQIIMMNKDSEQPDYKYFKQIEKSALRASKLTKQLLIFSRKVESELKPVNLNHEVKQVYKLLHKAIPKMIDIKLHLSEDLKIINADSMQLEQVVMNLGVNAKDAMPDGGELVFETKNVNLDEEYCKAHFELTPGEYVLFSIADTGHGMDKSTTHRIFEPFYTTKEIGKGTGLGLSMVYGIVKSHGGYIFCYSELGKGTIFKIYFPALVEEDFEQETDVKDDAELRGGNETILLVDDEEILRNQGKDMLSRFGYKVITAKDGEKAIELHKAKKDNIDLTLLDVGMPGMGGHKCLWVDINAWMSFLELILKSRLLFAVDMISRVYLKRVFNQVFLSLLASHIA